MTTHRIERRQRMRTCSSGGRLDASARRRRIVVTRRNRVGDFTLNWEARWKVSLRQLLPPIRLGTLPNTSATLHLQHQSNTAAATCLRTVRQRLRTRRFPDMNTIRPPRSTRTPSTESNRAALAWLGSAMIGRWLILHVRHRIIEHVASIPNERTPRSHSTTFDCLPMAHTPPTSSFTVACRVSSTPATGLADL